MINVLSASLMKQVEGFTINEIGISSPVLMERAALASFNHIMERKPKKILIFSGYGNNGGDGIALARMLALNAVEVFLVMVGNKEKSTAENQAQLKSFCALGQRTYELKDLDSINDYDVIVDALLGIGISRNVEGDFLKAIEYINSSASYKYSLDIPSGLNTDTGIPMAAAVKADETLCFSEFKLGLFLNKGPEYSGKVKLFDVGIISSKKAGIKTFVHAFTRDDVDELLPKRPATGHKGTFGKVLIIGGSSEMAGAALLSSKAAFAAGAGMVKLISSEVNREAILACLPELMYESSDSISDEALNKDFDWADVVLIGPGLSTLETSKKLVEYALREVNKPVILDADGLNIVADTLDLLSQRAERGLLTVLTPHPGEFKRLFAGRNDGEIISYGNPADVESMAKKYGVVIAAKNAKTLISDGTDTYINLSGTNGMGTAGSGDVLAGMMASILHNCLREKQTPISAVARAVFLHGLAGEEAAKKKSDYSMTASDIIDNIFVYSFH